MLRATHNNIIVKPQEENEKQYGSIIVPDSGKEVGLRGTIVSVGPGHFSINGTFINTSLKEGQKVILPPIGPVKVEEDNQEYWVCNETLVLSIIE